MYKLTYTKTVKYPLRWVHSPQEQTFDTKTDALEFIKFLRLKMYFEEFGTTYYVDFKLSQVDYVENKTTTPHAADEVVLVESIAIPESVLNYKN